jgi:uncharacterized repeat protein (TIGR02543 family)
MKNRNRHFWVIALVVIMAFAFIACGGDETTETFTVTFEANGGTPVPQAKTVEKGGKVTEPQGVTKANNALDGWYKEAVFSNKWNFATDTVTADITLHAKWELLPVAQHSEETITFDETAGYVYPLVIEGTFLDSEWLGYVTSSKEEILKAYTSAPGAIKNRFRTVFGAGVKIVLERNPVGYIGYKVGADFKTLYLNVDKLGSVNYESALTAMYDKNSESSLMKD